MTKGAVNSPAWADPLLEALRVSGVVKAAAAAARIDRSAVYAHAQKNPVFKGLMESARTQGGGKARKVKAKEEPNADWKDDFLKTLAETSNVRAAAACARVPPQTPYATRREDPGFAALWLDALIEGYQHLEMEVLGYLRNPSPLHKMDVGAALRLLAAHRETVAREQARRADEDEESILHSLNMKIERLKDYDDDAPGDTGETGLA